MRKKRQERINNRHQEAKNFLEIFLLLQDLPAALLTLALILKRKMNNLLLIQKYQKEQLESKDKKQLTWLTKK